jgi:antitoxin PrlF
MVLLTWFPNIRRMRCDGVAIRVEYYRHQRSTVDCNAFLHYMRCMSTLTITSRGQVTFKKEVLQHLGLKPGDKLELDLLPGGKGLLKAAPAKGKIDDVIGLLAKRSKKVATLEEISEAGARGWSGGT